MEYNNRLIIFARSLSRKIAFTGIGNSHTVCDRRANHTRSLSKPYAIADQIICDRWACKQSLNRRVLDERLLVDASDTHTIRNRLTCKQSFKPLALRVPYAIAYRMSDCLKGKRSFSSSTTRTLRDRLAGIRLFLMQMIRIPYPIV